MDDEAVFRMWDEMAAAGADLPEIAEALVDLVGEENACDLATAILDRVK